MTVQFPGSEPEPLTSRIEGSEGIVASENCSLSSPLRDLLARHVGVDIREAPRRIVLANCRPVLDALRSMLAGANKDRQFPPIVVDVMRHEFQHELAPQERELLQLIMANRGRFAGVAVASPGNCIDDLQQTLGDEDRGNVLNKNSDSTAVEFFARAFPKREA